MDLYTTHPYLLVKLVEVWHGSKWLGVVLLVPDVVHCTQPGLVVLGGSLLPADQFPKVHYELQQLAVNEVYGMFQVSATHVLIACRQCRILDTQHVTSSTGNKGALVCSSVYRYYGASIGKHLLRLALRLHTLFGQLSCCRSAGPGACTLCLKLHLGG